MQDTLYKPNCIRTFTGRYINLTDPDPEDIYPADIAIGLARLCRFGGHTKKIYSVAEHSDWCRQEAELKYPQDDTQLAFKALLHDAHEAYLGDVVSPLKALLPHYDNIANKMQHAIHVRFGVRVTPEETEKIKAIDKAALNYEFETKVLKWTGMVMDEKSRGDVWLNHFVRLCKHPYVIQ